MIKLLFNNSKSKCSNIKGGNSNYTIAYLGYMSSGNCASFSTRVWNNLMIDSSNPTLNISFMDAPTSIYNAI